MQLDIYILVDIYLWQLYELFEIEILKCDYLVQFLKFKRLL